MKRIAFSKISRLLLLHYMVLRFSADQAGAQSGTVVLTDNHEGKIVADFDTITAIGNLGRWW